MLASDGLLERVGQDTNSFRVTSQDVDVSGQAVSFSTYLNTGIVKVVLRPTRKIGPIDVMKFQGSCVVEFDGSKLPGVIVSASSNFDDSTFEVSFMPDGDT